MRGGEPAAPERQRAVGGVARRVHDGALPAARDVGRQQAVVEHAPRAERDDGLDEVGRRARAKLVVAIAKRSPHALAGARGGGAGAFSGAGSVRGTFSGSTTIVFDRPGSVMAPPYRYISPPDARGTG